MINENQKTEIEFMPCSCGSSGYKIYRNFGSNKVLECTKCGLFRNYPLPQKSICENEYQIVNESQDLHYHQLVVLKQVMKAAKDKNSEILDIGCSSGNMMLYLRNKGFKNISGIEMNDYAVESCIKKGLNVVKTDIDFLELPGSYDVIYLNHVLEHISDPGKFIKKAKAHLNRDSFMIIAVPNIGGKGTDRPDWIGYQFEQHFWYFTPHSLKKIFSGYGFSFINEIILTGGSFKSGLYRILRLEGDSLISIFQKND